MTGKKRVKARKANLNMMLGAFMVLGLLCFTSMRVKAAGDVASVTLRYNYWSMTDEKRYNKVFKTDKYASIQEAVNAASLPQGVVGRIFSDGGEKWRLLVNTTENAIAELALEKLAVRMERILP